MDDKDLRTESSLETRSNDGNAKYGQTQGIAVPQCNQTKTYQDNVSNILAKVDAQNARPCAVIGPDRVVPPSNTNDAYLKKVQDNPWSTDNVYRRPPDYPQKLTDYQLPTRNISPRQTFQENMQRIMVPPTYSLVKSNETSNFQVDGNVSSQKNIKINVSSDMKYCEVPYAVNPMTNEQKSTRNPDMSASTLNPVLSRVPHGWPPVNPNVRPPRPYGAPEHYQYQEFPSCAGPRPMPMVRPLRTHEDSQVYSEAYYQEGNVRFKPYQKERYVQSRYEYYPNSYHPPPPYPPHKYDLPKSSYPAYTQVPIKYLDRMASDPVMDGYQRPNQTPSYNISFRNQVIHPTYRPIPGNCLQNKLYSYAPDGSAKINMISNKLQYDKTYIDYDQARSKGNPLADSYYANENMMRAHPIKNQMVMPGYSSINMHAMQPHPYYRKENPALKTHEFYPHYRNMDASINPLARFPAQFSPNTSAISPADSNTSIETMHTQGTPQEDCGYVSQSSTASVRSIDSGTTRFPYDVYRRNDHRYGPIMRPSPSSQRCVLSSSGYDKDKKNIDVRQFLQMWNESEDEADKNNPKKDVAQAVSGEPKSSQFEIMSNPEQLYVLGLVNVPSEELSKYEHIQKISKLPENIKGYNSIELLHQFEEAIESSNAKDFNTQQLSRNFQIPLKFNAAKQLPNAIPRPVSPLDVEAKISQSVIHKEVGCNFEIKPCSPKMLNVEVAAPVQTILSERVIQKVTNQIRPECDDTSSMQHVKDEISSCKMVNSQYLNSNDNSEKNNYSLHDLESNPGVCFASLPRLDNDMELSFPEINQQFITANKIETPSSMKDLPVLDIEHAETNSFENNNCVSPNCKEISNKVCLDDTESEFSKLSKYRKTKKVDLQSRVDLESHAIRTDSVIIKNPENMKFIDEVSENHLFERLDMTALDTQQVHSSPQLLGSPKRSLENTTETTEDAITLIPTSISEAKSDDIAIDFSLTKIETESSSEVTLSENRSKIDSAPTVENAQGSNVQEIKKIVSCGVNTSKPGLDVKSKDIPNLNHLKVDFKNTNCEDFIPLQESNGVSCENTLQKVFMNVSDADATEHLTCVNKKNLESVKKIYDYCLQGKSNQIRDDLVNNKPTVNSTQSDIISQNTCNEIPLLPNVSIKSPSTDQLITDNEKNGTSLTLLSKNDNARIRPAKGIFSPWIQKLLLNSEGTTNLPSPSNLTNNSSVIESVAASLEIDNDQRRISLETLNNIYQPKSVDLDKANCLPNKDTERQAKDSDIEDASTNIDNLKNSSCENTLPRTLNDRLQLDCTDCHENNTEPNYKNVIVKEDENLNTVFPQENKLDDTKYNLNNDTYNADIAIISNENGISIVENKEDLSSVKGNNAIALRSSCEQSNLTCIKNEEINHDIDSIATFIKSNANDTINNAISPLHTEEKITYICKSPCSIDKNIDSLTQFHSNDTISDESLSSKYLDSPLIDKNECLHMEKDYTYCPDLQLDQHKTVWPLKRSLSDSALFDLKNNLDNNSFESPSKRKRLYEPNSFNEQPLPHVTQNNRRNSVASSFIEENLSFCILIQNDCIIEENNETDRICLTKIDDSCFSKIHKTEIIERRADVLLCDEQNNDDYSDPFIYETPEEKSLEEAWVEDIACVETVVSDDITEEVNNTPSSPNDIDLHLCDYNSEESEMFENSLQSSNHMDKVKYIYGNKLCSDDAELVETLYRTPQMNVNKTLTDKESHGGYSQYYDDLETVLSEPNCHRSSLVHDKIKYNTGKIKTTDDNTKKLCTKANEIEDEHLPFKLNGNYEEPSDISKSNNYNVQNVQTDGMLNDYYDKTQFELVRSCESSADYVVPLSKDEHCFKDNETRCPEVSSTTEEKNSSILLKITSYKGSRISQLKNYYSHKKDTNISKKNENGVVIPNSRPLITKAAQKYIPPLTETVNDLKIKLPLPQQSLDKLKQLKLSTSETKHKIKTNSNLRQLIPKKTKPKFEDILKSIDEIQIKMHKEKSKKSKKSVPMVVIKKNENGSHYASSIKDNFNPDLTGRKWQPWVFIEKNTFIDKMALKNKTRAVYNHRKNSYVLADKFRKYKGVTTQFLISHPNVRDSCTGLKYTIRLKHKY